MFGPRPEESLAQVGRAYLRHDLPTFRKYFNTEAILDNYAEQLWADSPADRWLTEKLGTVPAACLGGALIWTAEKYYIPGLARRAEVWLVAGKSPVRAEGWWGRLIIASGGAFAENMRFLLALQFDNAVVLARFTSSALVQVKFKLSEDGSGIFVTVLMERVEDHWQVTAVRDINALSARGR